MMAVFNERVLPPKRCNVPADPWVPTASLLTHREQAVLAQSWREQEPTGLLPGAQAFGEGLGLTAQTIGVATPFLCSPAAVFAELPGAARLPA